MFQEYVIHGKLSTKVDVYGFGVLLLEIVGGRKSVNPALPTKKISLVN
jgi:hypothetical protein